MAQKSEIRIRRRKRKGVDQRVRDIVTPTPTGNLSPDCTVRLGQAGMLAGMFSPIAPGQFGLNPNLGIGGANMDISKLLQANGVAALLSSLPFGRRTMAGFGEAALIAGLLAIIHNTLRVNLLKPNAANELVGVLQRKLPGKRFGLPLHPLFANPASLPQMMQVGSAAQALRSNLKIDIFAANAPKNLSAFLSHPSALAALSPRVGMPRMPVMNGLSKLSVLASAPRSLTSLGVKLPIAGASPFAALRTVGLASLWPAISMGSLSSQLKLPDVAGVSAMNSQMAALGLFEKLTGMKASDPKFGARVAQMMAALRSNRICGVLHDLPLPKPGGPGLLQVSSSLNSVRSGLGVNLLEAGAGAAVTSKLAGMVGQPSPSAGGANLSDLVSPLKRLADLGTALA